MLWPNHMIFLTLDIQKVSKKISTFQMLQLFGDRYIMYSWKQFFLNYCWPLGVRPIYLGAFTCSGLKYNYALYKQSMIAFLMLFLNLVYYYLIFAILQQMYNTVLEMKIWIYWSKSNSWIHFYMIPMVFTCNHESIYTCSGCPLNE